MQDYRKIIVHIRLGETDRSIRDLGLCGRRKAAELRRLASDRGWLDPSQPLPENAQIAEHLKPPARQLRSPLFRYDSQIKTWKGQGAQGTTIYEALVRQHGYSGSYSSVRRYLQKLVASSQDATVILDFNPGEAGQVDFGKGPTITDAQTGEVVSTWFFLMTLAFSRHQYAEIVMDQTVETWLGCHRRAFEFFGGVTERVIIDNPKCAITKACYHDPTVQRSYEEFAEGYGFKISACPPRDPKKKGRVESGVKYIKKGFLPLRNFRSVVDANEQLKTWIMEKAGNRIHGTTKQKPLELFETEKTFLKALPDRPVELARWAKAKLHGNCHVQFEKCFYSAPYKLIGKSLWLRVTETTVQIYHEHQMVAVHSRKNRPGERSTVRDHQPPDAVAYLMRDPTWCRKQAKEIGPQCEALIEQLFSHRVLDNLRAAQGVISLKKKYGKDRLELACRRAVEFDNAKYGTVKRILEKKLDLTPWLFADEDDQQVLEPVYTGEGRFCRDTKTMLIH